MTFLKKIGQVIVEGLAIVTGFGPILSQFMPQQAGVISTATSDLQLLSNIVINVEAVGNVSNMTGPQKLLAAAPMVEQAILSSAVLVGHKISNETLFKQCVTEYAQATVDLLNSLNANIDTTSKS